MSGAILCSSRPPCCRFSTAAADPAWLADLERATLLGDQEAILRQVELLAERDTPLAAELTSLANAFDHDRILALLQPARTDHANRQA